MMDLGDENVQMQQRAQYFFEAPMGYFRLGVHVDAVMVLQLLEQPPIIYATTPYIQYSLTPLCTDRKINAYIKLFP